MSDIYLAKFTEFQIDHREDCSAVSGILKNRYGIQPIRVNLKAGDYVINDAIGVERKRGIDFVRSLVDGRLFRQAVQLKRNFMHCLFILEGAIDTISNVHGHALKGAVVNLALNWRIPVLVSRDENETALFLWIIAGQNIRPYKESSLRFGPRPKIRRRRQLFILQGLPHIGPRLAGRLLNRFDNVERVMTASAQELQEVQGIGFQKASIIRGIVTQRIENQGQ